MKTRKIICTGKTMTVILFLTLIIASLTFAAEKDIVKTQGIIMTIEFGKNSMVVNEKQVVWDPQTLFNSDKGKLITVDQFKVKNWVYLEGIYDKGKKRILAKKIYLLPKYIDEKQKHRFPFMQ